MGRVKCPQQPWGLGFTIGLNAKPEQLGTIHQAFALQHVFDKHRHAEQPLHVCFVDFKSAYDKVQRPLLWHLLQRLAVHGDMPGSYNPCRIVACCLRE